jgi:hypothetical protein
LVPAKANRTWMNETAQRFAYRCIPLGVANASGWELLNPTPFAATWNGGKGKDAITLEPLADAPAPRLVTSHFGEGVLTFHTEYLFQTQPGWGLVVRGCPNLPKDGIAALEGLVETDWLPFPFTMNWLFTRPGRIEFAAGEPFAFITPTPHALLGGIQPELVPLAHNPTLKAEYETWSRERATFNQQLSTGEPTAIQKGWQRYYVKGETASGTQAPTHHQSARKLLAPILSQHPAALATTLKASWAEIAAKGPQEPPNPSAE